jgi:hypothetical protein
MVYFCIKGQLFSRWNLRFQVERHYRQSTWKVGFVLLASCDERLSLVARDARLRTLHHMLRLAGTHT